MRLLRLRWITVDKQAAAQIVLVQTDRSDSAGRDRDLFPGSFCFEHQQWSGAAGCRAAAWLPPALVWAGSGSADVGLHFCLLSVLVAGSEQLQPQTFCNFSVLTKGVCSHFLNISFHAFYIH